MTSTPFPLGRHVEHDARSLAFPAAVASTLKSVSHRHYGPILDQGQVGSCTGNAMAQALNTVPLRRKGKTLTEVDAVRLYTEATNLDNIPGAYPAQDTGSTGLAVAKAAQQEGLITSYTHAFGIDHALGALMNGPVICGTNWYESMFNPGPKGLLSISGSVQGGHEWAVVGVDVSAKIVLCLNSWGSGWGDKGRFRLTFDDFSRLLSEQGDVTVPVR